MEFRPCIDLHEGKVKQIVGGSLSDAGAVENYVSQKDAAYYAMLYKDNGLKGGHVIALGEGNDVEIGKALTAYPLGLQVGGGIHADNAMKYIKMGASHVIVTSYIFKDGAFNQEHLENMVRRVGRKRLVIDLSCRKKDGHYYVVTNRWQQFTRFEVNQKNIEYLSQYCDELLVHAVDVEGLRQGIDEELIYILSQNDTMTCTYAGGIASIEDINRIELIGNNRINYTIGSALDIFGGTIPFKKVLMKNNNEKQESGK